MEPKIATIDTSVAGAIAVINDKGATTYHALNILRIHKSPSADKIIVSNEQSGKLLYTYISGTDPDITITDGITPVVYDGSTPGVNDFNALVTDLAAASFS